MTIEAWWPRLRLETRRWLMANNGDAVAPLIVQEIDAAGGPAAQDDWWAGLGGSDGRGMPVEAVDWIEAVADHESDGG